jgi:hypothetical protein
MKFLIPTMQAAMTLSLLLTNTHLQAEQTTPRYRYTELQPLNDQQQKAHDDCLLEYMHKAQSDSAYQDLRNICYRRVLGYK